MSMAFVLTKSTPHPMFGWLGFKRMTVVASEELDDHDALLFVFAESSRPLLSKIASALYEDDELAQDEVRALLAEVRDLRALLEDKGIAAWPEDAPGPRVQPTHANIARMIATCRRVGALLEVAVQRQATIWLQAQ